jgi:spermidine synthase
MRRPAQVLLVVSAFLTGAGGMGLQSVLLAYLGLAAGHSLGGALGPGLFGAGWCLGAWIAGRHRGRDGRALAGATLAAPAAAALVAAWLHAEAARGASFTPFVLAGVVLAALPQGVFLTLQARAYSRALGEARVAPLYVANLLGALLGAGWIGLGVMASSGRSGALIASNLTVAAGAALGALGAFTIGKSPSKPVVAVLRRVGARQAAWTALVAALWIFGLEWLCLRIGVLWVGSQVGELTRIVACSLFALALGAAVVPRVTHRDARGVLEVLALACVASTWPLWAGGALAWVVREVQPVLRDSSWLESVVDVPLTLTLVVPTLAPLGALLPVLHRAMSGESGARLGRIFAFEALGALAAGPLLHYVLVPRVGVGGALAWLALCSGIAALGFLRHLALRRGIGAVVALSLAVFVVALRAPPPALASPKLSDPSLTVRAFAEDAHFAVTVVDDGINGERTLLTDTFRAAGDGRDYAYMRVLGHLPLLLHPKPSRVAVIALGTGTTLGSVALHDAAREIDVFEISSTVVEFAPWFERVNRGALAADSTRVRASGEGRVAVRIGDGRRRLAEAGPRYDVVTIEPLLPDSVFGVYLYTPEFYGRVRASLNDGGLFAQWVPPHAMPSDVCAAVVDAFARSFEWSSAWLFGTQLILLGGTSAPELAAARFDELGDGSRDELRAALDELGLASPDGLRARWVGDLKAWPRSERALRDADPWIVWRSRRADPPVLEWLPRNLELITTHASEAPWPASEASDSLGRAVRGLREARIALGWREARRRRGESDGREGRELVAAALGELAAPARDDGEIRAFLEEVEFLDALRRGVSTLAAGDARGALRDCLRAAELRPERGDTHLYLAALFTQLGEVRAATAALAKASELCPRWRETPAGQRALRLGLKSEQ